MNVTTAELRKAANALLDHLDATGQSEFDIGEDYYWNVPQAYMYDAYTSPQDLDMGQLSEDLDEVRKILSGESPPIGYALVWLASVLRRVGEKALG